MSHHPQPPKPEENLPNPSFFSWLKGQTTLFVSQIFGLTYVIASSIYYVVAVAKETETKLETINRIIVLLVDGAHIVLLTVFICVLIRVLDENEAGHYRVGVVYRRVFNKTLTRSEQRLLRRTSKFQLRKFKIYFLWFWCAMWVLYATFAFKHSLQIRLDPYSKATLTWLEVIKYSFFPFLTFALNNISLWFIFLCFTILYLPSHEIRTKRKQKRLGYFSGLVVCVLTILFPVLVSIKAGDFTGSLLTDYFTLFDAASGILNALVLAMLIARLDSKLIGLPSRLILILYCYSAVQPLFAVFERPDPVFETIQTLVLISLLLLKIYFFLIIVYTLQTGRMLNYLFCFPYLNRGVDSIFENQFEIKSQREQEHAFRFSILKDNEVAYLTDRSSKTRGDCDKRIEELREIMKNKSRYHTKEQAGTHWIEVMNSNNDVLCHSTGLRSEDDVKDLIEESIQKIPYCKYDRG
jgi:hypothetical protein